MVFWIWSFLTKLQLFGLANFIYFTLYFCNNMRIWKNGVKCYSISDMFQTGDLKPLAFKFIKLYYTDIPYLSGYKTGFLFL